MDSIILTLDGNDISGWKSVEASLSMENLSGSFKLMMTGSDGASDVIPGSACTLSINGSVVITGYVDKVNPKYDYQSHEIYVEGRDKAADLIDSSIINPPFQYKNLTIDKIIQRIAEPFGIGVNTKSNTGAPLPTYNIDQGAKAFETIHKLCKMRQCLCISDGKGNISITQAGSDGGSTALIEGDNILVANAMYDVTKRHDQYIAKGQKQGNDNSTTQVIAENKATVTDEFISRYRPLMVIASGQADANHVTQRARWEASTRRGKSRRINITVAGWEQNGGALWAINTLAPILSPMLFCEDVLLICEVKFKMDDSAGQLTELILVSPEAYQGMDGNSISKRKGNKGAIHSKKNSMLSG